MPAVRPTSATRSPGVGEPGGPTRELSPAEMERWLAGREVFDRNFTAANGVGAPQHERRLVPVLPQRPGHGWRPAAWT